MSRFTETLADHRLMFVEGVGGDLHWCVGCMDRALPHEFDSIAAHAAHVESMLVEAGVVAVELPEPTDTFNHLTEMSMMGWEIGHGPNFVEWFPDEIQVQFDGTVVISTNSREAPLIAAALLAAAAAAVRPVPTEEPR